MCPFLLHYERKSYIGVSKGFRQLESRNPLVKEESLDPRRKYRAIGQAYDKLFKAPPPTASVKSGFTVQDLARNCDDDEFDHEDF